VGAHVAVVLATVFIDVPLPALLCVWGMALASLLTVAPVVTMPWSAGLPGMSDGPVEFKPVPVWVYPSVSLAAAIASAVALALDAPVRAFAAIAAVALAGWGWARRHDLSYLMRLRALRRALNSYAPTTVMAYAGRSGAPWQLRMWEPYILRSGEPNIVVNLHAKYANMILDGAELSSPYIQLGSRGFNDLKYIFVPSLKASFYVQNARSNAKFLEHKQLTHVWLNHGDSDKPANFNPRHANYDKLVVCGQAGIDRYERHGIDIPLAKFEILGRPQASDVKSAKGHIRNKDPKVVLYAPTWHGLDDDVNFSSLEQGPAIVRALIARGATVIFRPHPLSYRWVIRKAVIREIQQILREDKAASGRRHKWGKKVDKTWSVADCANKSHALISDVSSVVSDFLQSCKPYAMTSMRASVEDFREEFTVAQTGYVLLGDLSNLDEVLDHLLESDPLQAQRIERKKYVLGDFEGQQSADAFAQFVRTLV
jgi:hypothetical protein